MSDYKTKRQELEHSKSKADAAANKLKNERDKKISDEVFEVKKRIHAEYRDSIEKLDLDSAEKDKLLREHINNNATHEFDGVKLFKARIRYYRYSSRVSGIDVDVGVGEVVRTSSQFAANRSTYSTPKLGSFIIRKIKKNGDPSKDFFYGSRAKEWEIFTPDAVEEAKKRLLGQDKARKEKQG